ncbi:hypothetical protein PIB30_031867, partial [Stylosanthes scabra]|nr:hypothetical protein [Stylosanthes scabra]
ASLLHYTPLLLHFYSVQFLGLCRLCVAATRVSTRLFALLSCLLASSLPTISVVVAALPHP